MQGIEINSSNASNALIECDGIISAAAKKLGVRRDSLSTFISKNPEMQEVLKKCREEFEEKRLDACEDMYQKFLNRWEKYPRLAFQSACYVLDNAGERRGFGKNKSSQIQSQVTPPDLVKEQAQKGEITQKDNDPIM